MSKKSSDSIRALTWRLLIGGIKGSTCLIVLYVHKKVNILKKHFCSAKPLSYLSCPTLLVTVIALSPFFLPHIQSLGRRHMGFIDPANLVLNVAAHPVAWLA